MALLSRVAESLFWLGRYVERAENTARLLDVAYHGRLEPRELEITGATNTWQALISTLGLDAAYHAQYDVADEAGVVAYLTVSRENPSSIVSALGAARENARSARDYLSSETWVAINRLYHATSRSNHHLIMADGLYDFCDTIRQGAYMFHGTADGTSLHDEGFYWLRTGELVERADMVTRIVDSKYHLLMPSIEEIGGPFDLYQWAAVLRSVSGYEAFRRTHVGGIEGPAVAEFLLINADFPRSLRACIDQLLDSLTRATDGAEARLRNPALRVVTDLESRLRFTSIDALLRSGLHEFIEEAQADLAGLTAKLSEAFFWTSAHAA